MAKKKTRIKQIDVAKLDPQLMKEAMKLKNVKALEDVINSALSEYIVRAKRRESLNLDNSQKIFWDGYLEQLYGL